MSREYILDLTWFLALSHFELAQTNPEFVAYKRNDTIRYENCYPPTRTKEHSKSQMHTV